MSDDASKRGNPDRLVVSGWEDYEVEYLMSRYDLSRNRALQLLEKHGNSRRKIEAELWVPDYDPS